MASKYEDLPTYQEIEEIRNASLNQIQEMRYDRFRETLDLDSNIFDASNSSVKIGSAQEITPTQQLTLEKILKNFCPWKKGPFSIFGIEIDAEWRSDLKWERVRKALPNLTNLRIADIGCHNGYFMFKMAQENPDLVIGIEPVIKHYMLFQLLQKYAQQPNLKFEPLGVEHMHLFPKFFDVVLCLGILYHHTDPMSLLRKIKSSLNKGATLIIDCQGIPDEAPVSLVPSGKYCGASGVWHLPSKSCIHNWLKRAGFRIIECFYSEPLSTHEQRATPWADIKSLKDFLDPNDSTKTIEGYPAPYRHYFLAKL